MTSDEYQVFEVVLKQHRRRWLWCVFTTDGDAIIEGSESRRPAAMYNANRALFQLLLCAPYRTKPLGRTVDSFGPSRRSSRGQGQRG